MKQIHAFKKRDIYKLSNKGMDKLKKIYKNTTIRLQTTKINKF